jgi:cell division septal protein FtsQ
MPNERDKASDNPYEAPTVHDPRRRATRTRLVVVVALVLVVVSAIMSILLTWWLMTPLSMPP